LHQNLNRKLARQLEQQLRKVGELRARVAPFLTVELAEAAKASRAICDALAPPVIKMFTHSVLSDLKVCVQILDPLYQRLKYAGAVPLSAISREKLCGKVTKLLGDDPSYTLHAINECGKHFEEEAARLDSQTQQGVSKWFANLTKMHETSLAISRLSNDAPRACADRDLTVLACQQGQELLQEFLQQVHTLRDIDATLLPRVKQQSVDTQSRAMAALEIIGSQLDNLRAETTWSELQRFAAPEIRMAAKRCQQLTRELASLWSELSKKTSADSSEAAEHAQAATLVIRNLLSAVATETTWGQLRRFLGLEPQRSARGLLAELNEYCELEKRLALRCDNVRNESYDCASVILEVLDNQFRVFSSDMLWGDLKKECSRLHAFKFALNRSAKIAEAATVQNLGPCRSIRELDAAYFKCQLTRHSAVTELTSLPPKLFSHATAQKLETGISRCSTLLDRKIQLAILIDMDDVPSFAEITSLLKSLKSEGTSFFRSLKPAYRSTRRRVAEFSRGLLPKSPAAVIERLESLRDWMQDSEAFRNDPELNEVFGDQFAGIDTDWARCKVLFQWAVTAGGRGISHAQACDMLRLRDPDQLSITEFNQNLKVLKAVIGDPGMQQLLGIGELQASQDVPLSLLIERTSYLCEAADVVGNAVSAFSVNDTDSLARVRELCKDALRVRELRERIGESTRWKALVKLAAQTDPKLTLHLDEPPPDDIKLLVSHAKELLDRVFSLSEAVRELDEWLSIFAIENTATLAEIKSLCEFVRRYSVIEEELADQLCWKPIASLCTSLVKPFRDLEQSERCHMAARGSQSAISDLLAIIEQIGDAVDELREHLSCFVIRDEDTLGDCKQFLLAVIERNAVSEKIRDARLWQGLGNLYHSIDSPIDELEELHRWCECLAKLDLPQELLDWLLVDDTSEKVAKLAAGIERFRLRVEPWQANLQNAALLLTWIDSIGAPLADGLQQATHLVNDDSEKLEDVLTRCRLVLETHRAEEEITNQKKWGSLGDLYRGVNSDPSEIAVAIEWTSVLAKIQLPESISTVLARGQTNKSCAELAEWCDELAAAHCGWLRCRKRFEQVGEVSADWMPWRLPTLGSSALSSIAARVLERASDLPAWAAFCRMRGLCQTAGLTDFANAVLDKTVPPDRISGVYRLTLLEAIAEEKIADSGLSRTFSRTAIEKARRKYRELDRELLFVNRSLVAHHASQHQHFAPAGNCTGRVGDYTEMGLIRHEIQKQRRHCRIRDLLTRAGNAAQALKPCFMMSPLSVSQYLDPEGIQFDLVVMDEASQIKPEDAIGVLLRAKQIVVVGDPKQLPPSSYFDRVSSDVADDDATQYDNTESILEVAMKAFQPIRRLRWHYRSLHESLIHFSNDRFYDGDLVVFPSPSTDEGALGLRFHYVEGASFDKGANRVEAERVAQAIVNHAKVNPQESLAVASFNAKQSGLIQDLLESLCVKDEEARFAVELLNGNERLLIKNLENLQGDERDVVFISYTYGPDPASGRVMNRFGPIAGEAGWRRLNVMVSRARRRVEVFSSIRHSDIQSGLSKSRGVTAFRDYLEYVQTGFLPDRAVITDRPMDSPLEEAVARAITSLGYEVVPQVGVAGYFIDFGIRLPGQQDFFLGVECDGATYHSSKSARDRDRLREEVICSRGWELHRIWSTDWYLNQKHEEERLAKRIAELVDHVEHD
jgi:very-short-patch-repair endonuclease